MLLFNNKNVVSVQMLCERLLKMYQQSVMIAEGEASDKQQRKQATAIALRLKAPSEIDLEEYYPAFLDMIRNLLDGKRFFLPLPGFPPLKC